MDLCNGTIQRRFKSLRLAVAAARYQCLKITQNDPLTVRRMPTVSEPDPGGGQCTDQERDIGGSGHGALAGRTNEKGFDEGRPRFGKPDFPDMRPKPSMEHAVERFGFEQTLG